MAVLEEHPSSYRNKNIQNLNKISSLSKLQLKNKNFVQQTFETKAKWSKKWWLKYDETDTEAPKIKIL